MTKPSLETLNVLELSSATIPDRSESPLLAVDASRASVASLQTESPDPEILIPSRPVVPVVLVNPDTPQFRGWSSCENPPNHLQAVVLVVFGDSKD